MSAPLSDPGAFGRQEMRAGGRVRAAVRTRSRRAGWDRPVAVAWLALACGCALRSRHRRWAEADEEHARRAAETARAVASAQRSARLAYFQALHDTVVATLVVIARGGLDHRSQEVRQRCARDADYIRRLLLDDAPPTGYGTDRLSDVIAAAESLGLRVHFRRDAAAAAVPPEVVEALGEATREALNNVLIHAQVSVCWVTVLRVGPALTVRIVDRGRGFRPEETRRGFGLSRSIADRMRAVGGAGRVSSAPGEGTTVELSWPA